MTKIIKDNLGNFLIILIIFLIVTGWIFSGWPQIWQRPSMPPEIPEAKAQTTVFYETFPNADGAWNGSSDTAQDEPGWATYQGQGDFDDIQVSNEDAGPPSPSGGNHLTFEDCDQGFQTPESYDIAYASIDLNGWTNVVIEYYWQSDDVDFGEGMRVAYSTDSTNGLDGTWIQIAEYINPPDDVWSQEIYSLSDPAAVANFKLRFSSRSSAVNEHMYVDDIRLTGTPPVVPVITVGTVGNQIVSMDIPSTNNYVGGAFTFVRDSGITDVTQVIITNTGTVNANANLSNVDLYYETTATCSYEGTENLFGTAASFGASEKAVVSGTMSVSTSRVCVYVVLDVGVGALGGETLEIEIFDPSTEITASVGLVSPATPVALVGTTTLQVPVVPPATWREAEDTPTSGVNKGENIRLRIEIINTGSEATDYDYLLEYAPKVGAVCGDDESFGTVPVTATTERFEMVDSTYFTNGDPTTAQLTVPGGFTFVSGRMIEYPSNSSGNITLPFENYTEIEFVFQATASAIDDNSYCFRATNAGAALDEYTIYPELQIAP